MELPVKLGDLIFQNLPRIPIGILRMVSLIRQVQGNTGPEHCGICTGFFLGIPLITEAFFFGVWTIPLPIFWLRWPFGFTTRTWKDQSIVPRIVTQVLTKRGTPYNIYYSDSDNAYYCTSLIAKAYVVVEGKPMSCTKTVKQVELSDPPAVTYYQKILGEVPNPQSNIWLVSDFKSAQELK